jgi:hypothetical protein
MVGMIHSITIGIIRMVLGIVLIGTCPITVGITGRSTVIRGTITIIGIGSHITLIISIRIILQTGAQSIMDQEGLSNRTELPHKLVTHM